MPFLVLGWAFFVFGTNIGTNPLSELVKDHTHPPYKLAVLRNRKGDLSKEWFVEFYAWSATEGKLIRKRIKIPLSYQDAKSRTNHANKLIAQVNKLLESGHHIKPREPDQKSDIVLENKGQLILALRAVLSTISGTLRPKSVVTYNSAIEKLDEFLRAPVDLRLYGQQDAIIFRDHLINCLRNSSRTANNTLIHLNTLFSHLRQRATLGPSPFKLGKLKQKVTSKNVAFIQEDQEPIEKHLLERDPKVYLFTRFVYYAFIRPGELLKLRVEDINFSRRYITIHGEISKSGKTETVPIIPPLFNLIGHLQDIPDKTNLIFGKNMLPAAEPSGIQVPFRRHEKALEKLMLDKPGYTLYSWKHTGAVNAYHAGVGRSYKPCYDIPPFK